jgi:hypothetical protein
MARDSKGRYIKDDEEDARNTRFEVFRQIERPITLKTIFVAFLVGWLAVLFSPKLVDKAESLIVDHYCKAHDSERVQVVEDTNGRKNGNSSQPQGF